MLWIVSRTVFIYLARRHAEIADTFKKRKLEKGISIKGAM